MLALCTHALQCNHVYHSQRIVRMHADEEVTWVSGLHRQTQQPAADKKSQPEQVAQAVPALRALQRCRQKLVP